MSWTQKCPAVWSRLGLEENAKESRKGCLKEGTLEMGF